MIDINTCNYLLALPKQVDQSIKILHLSQPVIRLNLTSKEDNAWSFLFQISKSSKGDYKISLHHQENSSYTGLARVDYNSGHRNPATANDHVPDFLSKYVGEQINESHIHLNIETYPALAWAIPLNDYKKFPIWSITEQGDYSKAVMEFSNMINLNVNFTIAEPLL